MIDRLISRINAVLPLEVMRIEVNDPFLSLVGENWSLALNCPWTLETPDETIPWESDLLDIEAEKLVGLSMEAASKERSDASDLIFYFTSGFTIHVFPDTDLDPWVMRLPDVVLIGRKSP